MSEQQARYALAHLGGQEQIPAFMLPEPVDLGQHLLEVRAEDQTVMVFKKMGPNSRVRLSQVQLSKEEAYRLLVTLQWVFQQEMEREAASSMTTGSEAEQRMLE